jgi:DMSO reductase anchor subunit
MRPAFSVVFLTTLIGVGQGLFLALYAAEVAGAFNLAVAPEKHFLATGALYAVIFTAGGLIASFFHLGRPERAWRSAAMWRTSWLSREVIALPAFMALAAAWGAAHFLERGGTLALGALAAASSLALFACTGMVYACIKFLQEWASGWTLVNFTLMGCASGFTLAAALAASGAPDLLPTFAGWALAFTTAALAGRFASITRNAGLRHRSTLQSAIGVANPTIRQIAQGFTGSSFNTIEFFHGVPAKRMGQLRIGFLLLAFVIPSALLAAWLGTRANDLLALAFVTQYGGLVAERWFFLADSTHPQNLYYQSKA